MKNIFEGKISIKANREGRLLVYEWIMIILCVTSALLLYYRCFFGLELTDESYYVSDALEMLQGNLPYAYNFFAYATGSAFLLIPLMWVYGMVFPNYEGVFLYSRICYLTFYFIVLFIIFIILNKHFKREKVLIAVTALIMFPSVSNLYNFSYNTVSKALSLLISVLLFDAIEGNKTYKVYKWILSGFLMGIVVLAHPAYGIVLIIFSLITIVRSKNGEKIKGFVAFCIGGILEILVVFIPIVLQVGIEKLIEGFNSMFNPYPFEALSSRSAIDKIQEVYDVARPMVLQMIVVGFICLLGIILIHKYKKLTSKSDLFKIVVSISMLELLMYMLYVGRSKPESIQWNLGLCVSLFVLVLIPVAIKEKQTIFIYVGIYPVVFAPTLMLALDRSDGVSRYGTAVPAIVAIILILLTTDSRWVKRIVAAYVLVLVVILGYTNFYYVYRDAGIAELNTRVEAGVYKGIITTGQRAKDVVELENYLNNVVAEDDYYAYRDNVPFAYLMTHKGIMCEQATWDMLQYSYKRNAPANLYNYYKRRGAIPTVIVYIDYGRDEQLSIDADWVRYNDFVNAYYSLTDNVALNETFYKIKVYRYDGGFEGNYDEWIEAYKELISKEE